jgi:Tfp pilus assembly protein FimT
VEVLVTMSVAAVLTAVAVPSFKSFLQNDRAITQSTSLVLSTATGRVATAVGKDLAGHTLVCP